MTEDPRIFVGLAFLPDGAKNQQRFPPTFYLENVTGSKDLDAAKIFQNASDALYNRGETFQVRLDEGWLLTRWQYTSASRRFPVYARRPPHCMYDFLTLHRFLKNKKFEVKGAM
jgi:hypothetical protein